MTKPTLSAKLGLLLALFFARIAAAQPPAEYPLIPYPTSLTAGSGSFTISRATKLVLPQKPGLFAPEAAQLQHLLANGLGAPLSSTKQASPNSIVLAYDPAISAPEGYRLAITPRQVVLTAKEPVGMFRAIQTLRQLLPPSIEKARPSSAPLRLPAVRIEDKPAYAWRGMHLDVARHFFSTDYLKKFIDLLALYKFNKLHLHLTDDQGWRIEIKKYPLLTEQGGWRTFNNQDSVCLKRAKDNPDFALEPQHLRQQNGRTEYGGFYTQAQLKEIIAFAAARHVEIIPEIDMPGHMMAAIRSYPLLSCSGAAAWGKTFSIPLCPCNETTYEFAENVLAEVAALFPSAYVHIGADEVEKTTWASAPSCQALMRQEGLADVSKLQSYFIHRIERFLKAKGKKLIGWDEMLEGGIDAAATVMYWRSWVPDAPAKAARNGNQVIMTPVSTLYFDALPDKNSLSNVYHFQVLPLGLNPTEAKRIIGAQANLWTEYVPSENRADYLYLPRMTALAEVVWSNKDRYASYLTRLRAHYGRLALLNVHYRVPDLSGFVEQSVFIDSTKLLVQKPLSTLVLRYATGDNAVTAASPLLPQPLVIKQPSTIKLAAFTPEGLKGDIYTITYQKQAYAVPVAAKATQPGLRANFFKGLFKVVNEIKAAKPQESFVVSTIQVPEQAKADQFGVQFQGFLDIPETGIYTFYLTCDDGGVLRVADRLVVDNDGLHSAIEKSGQIALEKGLQPLALDFVEGGGGYKLVLKYSKNGSPPQDIPASWLKH